MGRLAGHIIPGVLISVMGLVWIINSIWNHITNRKKLKLAQSYTSVLQQRSWLPLCCCPNLPVEPLLKILMCLLVLLIEVFFDIVEEDGHKTLISFVYHIFDSDGKLLNQGKFLHLTIVCSFMLSGAVDLLAMCMHLPRHASNTFLSLSFVVEGLVFHFHQTGKTEVNEYVHAILIITVNACIIFSVLRFLSATNLFINLGLGSCVLLQGTWLIQAGYFLFGGFTEKQKEKDGTIPIWRERDMFLFIGVSFAWKIMLICVFNAVVWISVSLIKKEKIFRMRILRLPRGECIEDCEEDLIGQNSSEITDMLELKVLN